MLGSNGLIYGVPFNASSVLVVDPADRRVRLLGGLPAASGKWTSGVMANDGRIA